MYVDCWYDRKRDRMKVAERRNGQRVLLEERVEHVLYYEHGAGQHRTIFGDPCKKYSTPNSKKFERMKLELAGKKNPPRIFESDIRTEFRYLAKHYMGSDTPILHLGFFDIETDFDPDKGFAPTEDPFNKVTAISVYLSSTQTLYTLALSPSTLTIDAAREMVKPKYDQDGKLLPAYDEEGNPLGGFENTTVFDNEKELLEVFLDLIEDVDVLSGWNSEGYDIPYMVNRVKRVLGEEATRRFCLWGLKPREREYIKFAKKFKTYDLVGRQHLDYLVLYQKHTAQQQHSYRLDFIAEIEVQANKTPYSGTLDNLYRHDFYKFVDYNRTDVHLLVKIDEKKKFIELANQIAHSNCVLLKTTVGSVALVEQAIINEMHAMGFVVPDRKPKQEETDDREGLVLNVDPAPKRKPAPLPEPEIDASEVEERLMAFVGSLSEEDRLTLHDTLVADWRETYGEGHEEFRDSEVLADPEEWLDYLGGYLAKTEPELFGAFIMPVMSEEPQAVEVYDLPEPEPDDDDEVEPWVKMSRDGKTPVVGAYVAKPKIGLQYSVACVDINSLYPSCIRAINMSPETIVGQVRPTATMSLVHRRIRDGTPRAEAWDGLFCLLEIDQMHQKTEDILTIDFEDGRVVEMTGAEFYQYIYEPRNQLCVSANGTIFSTAKEGIIPHLLAKWYSERKAMQAKEKAFEELAKGIEISPELASLLAR